VGELVNLWKPFGDRNDDYNLTEKYRTECHARRRKHDDHHVKYRRSPRSLCEMRLSKFLNRCWKMKVRVREVTDLDQALNIAHYVSSGR